jgi:hypothetical protein
VNAKRSLVFLFLLGLVAMLSAVGSNAASYQIWPSTATPTLIDVGSSTAGQVELGISFKSDVSGYITGVRFYKSVNNTGTHIGNLWSGTGTLLASATFTNETASGWQQVNFSHPVLINANTRYIASYYCPSGHYSDDRGFFSTSGVDSAPLHALQDTSATPNGPFTYASTSQFPASTYQSSNYWVDVAFTPATAATIWPGNATPTLIDVGSSTGGQVELGMSFKSDVSGYVTGIRFYKSAANIGTHVGNLWSGTGALLASATFTSETVSGWQQVNFARPVLINANTRYVASYYCPSGHYSDDRGFFATRGVDNTPLHALQDTSATPNGPFTYASTSQFPASTYQSSNYWVDVVFSGTGGGSGTQSGQLIATPTSLSLGNVPVGTKSAAQTITLKNLGTASLSISQVNVTGSGFAASGITTPLTLAAGQSASLSVTFGPTAAGTVAGSVSVVNSANSSPTTITLSGAGIQAQLAVTPSSASFGNVVIDTSNSQTFTLANRGSASVTISQANVTGTGFALSGLTTPLTIAAGNRATFNAVFTPTAGTGYSGSISLVSNAPNSPLGINLSGTGVAPTHLLAASPTSLSFGNVNTGSSSPLKVTLTNNGNSNVTISSVNASGAGYTASGVNANTTLTPGQTATVNVAFAPAAAGSAGGSVSVASNASNSPATISLSGSGVTQSTSNGAPICGISGDSANHIPTDWSTFVPPAKGQSYVDSSFGCTVTRITDASKDVWSGSFYLPLTHGYATVSSFNANDSYLMLADGWNRHFVTDLTGNIVVSSSNMPASNDTWFLWDASNASVFYYTNGNSLMKGTISGSSVATTSVRQFSEYPTINFMDEADVSQDGAHVVVIGGDTSGSSPENVFVYDLANNTKGPVYTTSCTGSVNNPNNGCLHKLIQTPDNNVIIQFASDGSGPEQGNRLWAGTYPLPHLQDLTNHLDAGYDLNGNAIFIESGNSYYTSGLSNPCPSGWGLDVRQIHNTSASTCLLDNPPSWHVGYRGNSQQPWAGLSFFDVRGSSPEWFDNSPNYVAPNASTWLLYEDEIMVARIDANNNSNQVYRLARAYSRSGEDFNATPKAAISRDGKYIAFDSDMAYAHSGCPANFQTGTNCIDVYVIKVR